MASTITSAILNVSIREKISLNGVNRGSYTTTNISSIGEIDNRIMSITNATHGTDIFNVSTAASSGTHAKGNLKYMRITNLDSVNFIIIMFTDGDGQGSGSHNWEIKLEAGKSVVLGEVASIDAANDIDSFSAASITKVLGIVKGNTSDAPVDIEVYIAST